MKAPELQEHADKGSQTAKDELARRDARKAAAGGKVGGKREGVAFNPKPEEAKKAAETPAPAFPEAGVGHTGTLEELQKSHPIGAQAYVKGYGLGTVESHHPAAHDNTAVTVHIPGYGTLQRTTDQVKVGKDIPAAALAAKARRDAQQAETDRKLAETKSARVQYSEAQQKIRDDAVAAERVAKQKAVIESTLEASKGLPPGYASVAQSERGLYHDVIQTSTGNTIGRTMEGTDYSRRKEDGSLVRPEGSPKIYRAAYDGKIISTHDSRAEASNAVIEHHKINQARTEAATTRTTNLSKRVAAGTSWQAAPAFEHDGTAKGMAAAQKIKQAYQMGNHKVLIEPSMTKEQTHELLKNISEVVQKTGTQNTNTTFHVPTGDKNFRSKQRGSAMAYVRPGQDTVFISPHMASGESARDFGRNTHLMDAAKTTNGQQYTITHELGHIQDVAAHHTRESAGSMDLNGRKLSFGTMGTKKANDLMQANRTGLSTYGNKTSMEAYAEAYAQWIHGGPGSSKAADAYAKEFGWAPPSKS